MKHGFIKVATATTPIKVADCHYNQQQITQTMQVAYQQQVKLLVFPELCVTAYTCGDLLLQTTLLQGVLSTLEEIRQCSQGKQMITIVGAPLIHCGKLYNCAVVFYDGAILGVVPKTHLPNYSEFYEQRHFTPAPSENTTILLHGSPIAFGSKLLFQCQQMPSFCFAVELCEDAWVPNPPSIGHCLAGATVIANLSASDEIIGKDQYRSTLVSSLSASLVCGYLYADAGAGESTTDMVYSGHNIIAENGTILQQSPLFSHDLLITEIDVDKVSYERRRLSTYGSNQCGYQRIYFTMDMVPTTLTRHYASHPFIPSSSQEQEKRWESILMIQAQGLKTRLAHTGSQSVVLGISGGLDSTLALLVAAKAMDLLQRPHAHIVAVTMPCFGTTNRTRSNAEKLCQQLGVTFRSIDITKSVLQHFADISHPVEQHTVVFENAQARERTQVLMDIANQSNGFVIGTGDLSELALGWATYNGDHMSMYALNSSIPKTLVRHLVQYVAQTTPNNDLKTILLDIVQTPVSPELLPHDNDQITQKTEDLVGPYELHDFFLYYMLRWGFGPEKIYRLAQIAFDQHYDNATILTWLKTFIHRFFSQQFKRSCLPDGPKVGSVTLSPRGDWRMPSDACATLWLKEVQLLATKRS